jgi:uncharacterized protein
MPNQYDYPGVYIEELPVAGPIQPVGTSTAAFVGVALKGPVNQPTFITSFDAFRDTFGADPIEGFYLWYAVRGFFENGGRRVYIVRVSAGEHARLNLLDSRTPTTARQTALVVEGMALEAPNPAIQTTVTYTSQVTAQAFRPSASFSQATADRIQITAQAGPSPITAEAQAAQFRPGDRISVQGQSANPNETATLQEVRGAVIILTGTLQNSYTNGNVRLANIPANQVKVLRLDEDAANLAPGSVIAIRQGTAAKGTYVVRQVQLERIGSQSVTYRVELEPNLSSLNLAPTASPISVTTQDFDLRISQNGRQEAYSFLSMARNHPRYAPTFIVQQQEQERQRRRLLPPSAPDFDQNWQPLAAVHEPDVPTNANPADRRPALTPTPPATAPLTGGAADVRQNLTLAHFQTALDALRTEDEVNFITIPDSSDPSVQLALLTHCEQLADRFAIFDPPFGLLATGPGSIRDRVALLRSDRGFGALYYPWIQASHPKGGLVFVPPSGHVAGIYARADSEQGVHKAPANYTLNGSLGAQTSLNDETQGPLNLDGINVLRVFPGQARPIVWGARTTSKDTAWQYVNIRRLLLFIEESIQENLRWAVFQPNNLQLWQQIKRTIGAFLTNVWRTGGLFGATADEAFYVRIDESNNPEAERKLGRLYIEIGVRPVYPAEFIVVRISFWEGSSAVTE